MLSRSFRTTRFFPLSLSLGVVVVVIVVRDDFVASSANKVNLTFVNKLHLSDVGGNKNSARIRYFRRVLIGGRSA